ncbi:MAG: peptide-methionine (S)-S-oxide reductase, partial [Pseudomonadales bacterium]|nr:peptide-methionine (S)-S-oxide reductase [Pseudomonadales bacterium]
MLGKIIIPESDESLVGREQPMALTGIHAVNGRVIRPPFVDGLNSVFFGMGCFWGAERLFWQQPGVFSTAVGYGGGTTLNPLYEEVCSGRTGHTEL